MKGGSMIGVNRRRVMGGGGKEYTARDYSQDGLWALWDGLENVGFGQNDPTSTTWVNLSGDSTKDMTVHADWNSKGLYFDGTWCGIAPKIWTSNITIECVCGGISGQLDFGWSYQGGSQRYSLTHNASGGILRSFISSSTIDCVFDSLNKYFALSIGNWGRVDVIYTDGVVNTSKTLANASTTQTANRFRLGAYGTGSDTDLSGTYYIGTIYRCAIYERVLSAEEIAHHYAIDKQRFGI